jgi:hypothetical protein
MFKVIMAKGRTLKIVRGDLETQKQNVASSKLTIGDYNATSYERDWKWKTRSLSSLA